MRAIDKGSSITKVNKVDKLLDDYGIKDISTLKYILDQYQKVIVNITKNKMSYLTYPAETILSVVSDIYNENLEKEIDDLNTELSEYRQNAIVFKPEFIQTFKDCKPKREYWHNVNPDNQSLQEIRYRAALAEFEMIEKMLRGWGIKLDGDTSNET